MFYTHMKLNIPCLGLVILSISLYVIYSSTLALDEISFRLGGYGFYFARKKLISGFKGIHTNTEFTFI